MIFATVVSYVLAESTEIVVISIDRHKPYGKDSHAYMYGDNFCRRF